MEREREREKERLARANKHTHTQQQLGLMSCLCGYTDGKSYRWQIILGKTDPKDKGLTLNLNPKDTRDVSFLLAACITIPVGVCIPRFPFR